MVSNPIDIHFQFETVSISTHTRCPIPYPYPYPCHFMVTRSSPRWNLGDDAEQTPQTRQTVGFHTQAPLEEAGWLLFSAAEAAAAEIFWWYPTNIVSRMANQITKMHKKKTKQTKSKLNGSERWRCRRRSWRDWMTPRRRPLSVVWDTDWLCDWRAGSSATQRENHKLLITLTKTEASFWIQKVVSL